MLPKKYTKILFICLMSFSMSLIMTLIITYINTGFDEMYHILHVSFFDHQYKECATNRVIS